MRSWVVAASLMAAAMTTGAQAADLDEGPPPDRYGSAYDDPRYADIYKYPKPPAYAPPPGPYAGPYAGPSPYAVPPPYAGPVPRERIYRDDYGYGPEPRRYSYAEPVPPYAGGRCAPRELVKERLYREGWRDFHDGDVRGGIATIHARRPNGRLFVLAIDRCSGEIVRADPLDGYPAGPYAYGPQPRRWDRAY